MLKELKEQVCEANIALSRHRLAPLTWGNVSGMNRERELMVIKPSGVSYADMTPDKMVVLDLNGKVIEGSFRPSSDAPTHLVLYREFDGIYGITHAHSTYATSFAQSCRSIPCFGTTHADLFYGEVPVTRRMKDSEISGDYEKETGNVIVETFSNLDPLQYPGVLVANHGPFVWGKDPVNSVENALALEEVAKMAVFTCLLSPLQEVISPALLDKHYLRKHGKDAYYGQK